MVVNTSLESPDEERIEWVGITLKDYLFRRNRASDWPSILHLEVILRLLGHNLGS